MRGWNPVVRWRTAARAAALVLTLAAGAAAAPTAAAAAAGLVPFDATYNVNWRGMNAGTARLTLTRAGEDAWTYESRNTARGVFRVAVPGVIHQTSELRIEDGRVVPQRFRTDDGSEKSRRDVDVRFDWAQGRATGTAEGEPVDAPLQPGLQDTLSVQIALINELQNGRTPEGFVMLDGDDVKDYLYTAEGKERVETALGPYETIRYRSRRPDSDRATIFWCAPELGYLPVKVERQRGSKIEWSMAIAQLERQQ